MAAIDRLEYIAGDSRNTSEALDVSRNFVFNSSPRGNRPNAAVIIMGGKVTDPTTVEPAIDRLHAANVTTYVIGVKDGRDEQSLKQLASDPKQVNRNQSVPSSTLTERSTTFILRDASLSQSATRYIVSCLNR